MGQCSIVLISIASIELTFSEFHIADFLEEFVSFKKFKNVDHFVCILLFSKLIRRTIKLEKKSKHIMFKVIFY